MAGNGPLFFPGNSCKSLLCENCELRFNSYQSIINVTSPPASFKNISNGCKHENALYNNIIMHLHAWILLVDMDSSLLRNN